MNRRQATTSYVLALIIYGTIAWPLAYINLPSEIVVMFRGFLGAVFLLGVVMVSKKRFETAEVRANFGWLVASGLCLGLNWVLLFAAYRTISVAVACLCNYMAPVMLIAIAPLVLGERRSYKKVACAAVAIVGLLLVTGILEGSEQMVDPRGILLALGAAIGFVGMVIFNKKMGPVPVYEKAFVQIAFASLPAVPFALAAMGQGGLQPDALSIGLVILLGVVHTGFAYSLYFGALSGLSAQTIAVVGYVEPAVSVIVSTVILHQPLSAAGWLGAVLIISAAAVSEIVE